MTIYLVPGIWQPETCRGSIPCGCHQWPPCLPDFLHDRCAAAQMGPLCSETLKRSMVAKPGLSNCFISTGVYKIQFSLDSSLLGDILFPLFLCGLSAALFDLFTLTASP